MNIFIISYSFSVFMKSESPQIKGLEDKHIISIIMFLYKNGRVKKSEIYRNVSYTATMVGKIDALEDMGLLTQEQKKYENNTIYIELTERGLSVAKKLLDIESIILGEEPETQDDFVSTPSQIRDRVT